MADYRFNNELIKEIILSQKDFELLPRDEGGCCVYGGNLYLSSYGLNELPDKLNVTGTLNCHNNNLVSIPVGLSVYGDLYCSDNKLTSLPNDLVVDGDLYCSRNQLTSIPDDLYVRDNLYCSGNKIAKEIKASIGGYIKMDNEQKLNYNRAIKLNRLNDKIDG